MKLWIRTADHASKVHCDVPATSTVHALSKIAALKLGQAAAGTAFKVVFNGKVLASRSTLQACRGLSNHSVVEIQVDTRKPENVRIALQTPGGRLSDTFPATTSLHDLLSHFVDTQELPDDTVLTASLQCMGSVIDAPNFIHTTLQDIGIFKGQAMLRMRFHAVDAAVTLAERARFEQQLLQAASAADSASTAGSGGGGGGGAKTDDDNSSQPLFKPAMEETATAAAPARTAPPPTTESNAKKAAAKERPDNTPPETRIANALRKMRKSHFDDDCRETIGVLVKIADNLIRRPDNAKVRTLRLKTTTFQDKIQPRRGAVALLKVIGFKVSGVRGSDVRCRHSALFAPYHRRSPREI